VPAAPLIRDLRPDDFDDLVATYYRCYDERAEGEPIGISLFDERPSMEAERGWFDATLADGAAGASVRVVAEVDRHAVGTCIIRRSAPSATHEGGHVGVLGILVDRAHRGHGVGSALLRAALDRSRGRFEIVTLSVLASNPRAEELYRRFGFVRYGVLPRAMRRGAVRIDSVLMALELGTAPH